MNDNFLTLDEFREAMKKIEPVFDVEKRLPGQVFKRPYRFHLLCEFDSAMDDLLKALQKMRSPLADETVLFCVLDADPITFFYREFQKIYGFYFKANISVAEYFNMHWVESFPKVDPIPFHTELEVYLSGSANWAMWGERSREIAMIGLDDQALAAAHQKPPSSSSTRISRLPAWLACPTMPSSSIRSMSDAARL